MWYLQSTTLHSTFRIQPFRYTNRNISPKSSPPNLIKFSAFCRTQIAKLHKTQPKCSTAHSRSIHFRMFCLSSIPTFTNLLILFFFLLSRYKLAFDGLSKDAIGGKFLLDTVKQNVNRTYLKNETDNSTPSDSLVHVFVANFIRDFLGLFNSKQNYT